MKRVVSILIFVEIVLEVELEGYFFKTFIVSILIFVEIVLEALDTVVTSSIILCFNPYFRGDSSGRDGRKKRTSSRCMFQSLFSWR